jgi:hypothetical protein
MFFLTGANATAFRRAFTSWNPSDLGSGWSLSGSNLVATGTTNNTAARGTPYVSAGKVYCEVTWTSDGGGGYAATIGVANASASLATYLGGDANGWSYYSFNGKKINNTSQTSYGSSYAVADIIGVALDMTAGKVWFAKNGTWQNSGDPAAGTGEAFSGLTGSLTIAVGHTGSASGLNDVFTLNVGPSFAYTPPTGFGG